MWPACAAALATMGMATPRAAAEPPHNVVIFVADGLRSGIVDAQTAAAMAAVRTDGVDFRASHSLYPTITTPNAAAIATGHRLGYTGDFGNVLFVGEPFPAPYASPIQPLRLSCWTRPIAAYAMC